LVFAKQDLHRNLFFQVIYPLSHAAMRQQGRTDEDIIECLRWAQCSPEEVDGRADLQFVVEGKVQILKSP